MIDSLTEQIINKLTDLPINKKKAILELINLNDDKDKTTLATRKRELLSTSAWSDSEINEIYRAREYINKWKPQDFF